LIMAKKIGRNDICWCGSENKYKKCHLDRDKKTRPSIEEARKVYKKTFSKKYCLHPEANSNTCKGGIVKAHSIQRGGGLSCIAEDNHVYRLMPKVTYSPPSYSIDVERIGINDASTFNGFCNFHDNNTFSRIEKYPFEASIDQIFLLAYRAQCRETFMKNNQFELLPLMREMDKGRDLSEQREIQEYVAYYGHGVALGMNTSMKQKAKYDCALLNNDYSDLIYYVVFFDNRPELLCSGASILETDFLGRGYNQLGRSDIDQEEVTFSIIPTDKGLAVAFASLDRGKDTQAFFSSLSSLGEDNLPNAIVRYAFEYYENTYFSPLWWKSLTPFTQQAIRRRFSSGISPDSLRRNDCLLDDGINMVTWQINKIVKKIT
jgi:hypothetical protein